MSKNKVNYDLFEQIMGTTAILEKHIEHKKVELVKIDELIENKYQPRFTVSKIKIKELANSIRQNGLLHPILITKIDESPNYTILAGHRRVMAFKFLQIDKIEAIIIDNVVHEQLVIFPIIENLQRVDLLPVEKALIFRRIIDEKLVPNQEVLAERIGLSKSWLSRLLSILKLPEDLLEKIKELKYKDVLVISALNKVDSKIVNDVFEEIRDKSRKQALIYIKEIVQEDKSLDKTLPFFITKDKVEIYLNELGNKTKLQIQPHLDAIKEILLK